MAKKTAEMIVVILVTILRLTNAADQLIKVTGLRSYQTGQELVLNCETINRGHNNSDLTWSKDGHELKASRIGGDVLQIRKNNVNSTDAGVYLCAVRRHTRVIRSVSVYVIVGDTPSKPSNTKWTQIGRGICLSWSPVKGTAPVSYRVRYRCKSECFILDANSTQWEYVTCKKIPRYTQRNTCCLTSVDLYAVFEAVVEATNIFGTSSSEPFNFTRDIQVQPSPPRSLKAFADGYGEISLDWSTDPDSLLGWSRVSYIIYYSAQGDQKNKTLTIDSTGQNYYRITRLKPYTNYTIYIAAIDAIFKKVGIPAGPVTIVTREENPSDAPEIVQCKSIIDARDPNHHNVVIQWKLPPKETWNGKITKYIIQYRRIPRSEEIDTSLGNDSGRQEVIDNSKTQSTLVGLRINFAYNVHMQMCNRAGCGGIGDNVMIKPLTKYLRVQIEEEYPRSTVILCIAISVLLIIILAATIMVFKIKRKQQVSKSSKSDSLIFTNDNLEVIKA